MTKYRYYLYTSLATALSSASLPAQAQSTAPGDVSSEPDEIVVTARRGAEQLQDVPASISVLTERDIEQAGVDDAASITSLTSGVTIVTGTAEVGDTQVNIRGINGARDAESNVALVVDGVLKTNTAQLNQIQGRLTQVEVLKGPQGAYYGRNAAAGAIVMTTQQPTPVLSVSGKASYGENETYAGQAVVSGPLGDNLGAVVYGDYRKTDGFFRNNGPIVAAQGATVDRFEGFNLGGRLMFENGPLTLDLKSRYGELRGGALIYDVAFALPGFAAAFGNPDFQADVNEQDFNFQNNVVSRNQQDTFEVSLRGVLEGDAVTVSGFVLYSDVSQQFVADATTAAFNRFAGQPSCLATTAQLFNAGYQPPSPQFAGPTPASSLYDPFGPTTCDGIQFTVRDQKDISAELRIASTGDEVFDWSFGGYYLNIDRRAGTAITEDRGLSLPTQLFNPPGTDSPTSQLFDDQFDTNVYAVFGSVDYELSDQLDLSAALRFDREERTVSSNVPNVLDPATGQFINPSLAFGPIADQSAVFQQLQPKISIAYKPTPDLTLFANWGIGFKAGGFNQQGSGQVIDNNYNIPLNSNLSISDQFRKERSSAFEGGFKAQLFDDVVNLNGAVYYTQVTDMQFFEFFAGPFGVLRVVSNIDRVDILGFEADVNVKPITGIDLFASVNVTDSEIKRNESRPDTVGNTSPYTADYTLNFGVQATQPVSNSIDAVLRTDYRITGPTWFSTVQDQQVRTLFDLFFPGLGTADYSRTQRDAFGILNLRAGLRGENWSATLFADNLFNKNFLAEVIPAPEFGGSFVSPGARRTIGVEVGFDF